MQQTFAKEFADLVQKHMTPMQVSNVIAAEAFRTAERFNLMDLDRAQQGLADESNKADMKPNEYSKEVRGTITLHLKIIVAVRTFRETINALSKEKLN